LHGLVLGGDDWLGARQRGQRLVAVARQQQALQIGAQAAALRQPGEQGIEPGGVVLQRAGSGWAGKALGQRDHLTGDGCSSTPFPPTTLTQQTTGIGGLTAHIGEQVPQPVADCPQPAALGVIAQQDLGDDQTDKFGVAESGRPGRPAARFQQLVDGDVQCDDQVVEDGTHQACSLEVDVVGATPILGGLLTAVTSRQPPSQPTSVI
jgi:hypothetical protein